MKRSGLIPVRMPGTLRFLSEVQTTPVAVTKTPGLATDLQVLTKVRLNSFVLITTFFGFWLGSQESGGMSGKWMLLLHTIIGTAAAAFGSAAFNQLMEIEDDARMRRTSDRPLPSQRMSVVKAFLIAWGLSAFGVLHLAVKVNSAAALLAAATIAIYVFVYTPMKKWHATNTLVGAIPGAIPPLLGWVAAGGEVGAPGGWFLFALLFFWQLPHFVAISWLCREEYEQAGYQMWSNGDESGKRTTWLFLGFSDCLIAVVLIGASIGLFSWYFAFAHAVLVLVLARPLLNSEAIFGSGVERPAMKKAFLGTLLYLPLVLLGLAFVWS